MFDIRRRREQLVPAKGEKGRVSRVLNKSVLGQEEPPAFAAGALRDYQWEGVRWMLFNWSQRRNRCALDYLLAKFAISTFFLVLILTTFSLYSLYVGIFRQLVINSILAGL